ncbi:MAG: translation initiation factor 2 [Thiothrix lacustris]|uniref:Translation initiation factor 2 n=1 Tax=Thiothrix lacustris TaxID=525917 RepID=A0A1Y1QFP5_9GAMM|nr:MAG: translation initiation factor 2 [Thiothrix lacustris]
MKRYWQLPTLTLILATTLLNSGCATITRGSEQDLKVESEPVGASVTLSNGMKGTTPANFKVPRKNALTVMVAKPGYKTATVQVTPETSENGTAGLIGNAVFGGVIGIGVDATSGALNDLKPNPVKVTLEKGQ